MADTIKRILKMVEERKISPEEGAKLIEAVEEKKTSKRDKSVRIIMEDGSEKIGVKLPLNLVRLFTKFVPKGRGLIELNGQGLEIPFKEIIDTLEKNPTEIITIEEENGVRVKVWVE